MSSIKVIHGNQDEKTVKSGFHRNFIMLVLQENNFDKVTVDRLLARIETMKADNPELWKAKTTCNFVEMRNPVSAHEYEITWDREVIELSGTLLRSKMIED